MDYMEEFAHAINAELPYIPEAIFWCISFAQAVFQSICP